MIRLILGSGEADATARRVIFTVMNLRAARTLETTEVCQAMMERPSSWHVYKYVLNETFTLQSRSHAW